MPTPLPTLMIDSSRGAAPFSTPPAQPGINKRPAHKQGAVNALPLSAREVLPPFASLRAGRCRRRLVLVLMFRKHLVRIHPRNFGADSVPLTLIGTSTPAPFFFSSLSNAGLASRLFHPVSICEAVAFVRTVPSELKLFPRSAHSRPPHPPALPASGISGPAHTQQPIRQ